MISPHPTIGPQGITLSYRHITTEDTRWQKLWREIRKRWRRLMFWLDIPFRPELKGN